MNFTNFSLFAAPVCLLAIWIESHHLKNTRFSNFSQMDLVINIVLGLQALIIGSIASLYMLSISYAVYTYFETWRFELLGYRNLGWSIGVWALAVVGDDFTYYWFHRGGHKIRIMWAAHVVHHSSEHFNLSTAIRLNWVRGIFKPILWLWMPALGFHPLMLVLCIGMSTLYQFFCHTRFCPFWDKFSWLLNTPGLHAVHHGVNDHCIDKNFSGVFIVFDRLFGTYTPLTNFEDLHFGVTDPPSKESVWEISTHEFKSLFHDIRQSKRWVEKIQYMLQAPGWKPKTE